MDATLSYRWSCHMAICGSCGMMSGGEAKLACHAFLRDYRHGVVRIEPLDHFPIERDLVIVMDSFIEKLSSVKPYVIAKQEKALSEGENLQTPLQLMAFKQYTLCINCLLCYAACPQCGLNESFVGPAALALPHRRNPADQAFRLAGLVPGAAAAGSAPMSRRPYIRKVKRSWWLGHRRYVVYMVRELTSLFVGLYCAVLAVGLVRLAQGHGAWDGFLALLSSPLGVLFQLICLAFAAYHSVTWFALTPKAMPLAVRGAPVPAKAIVGMHYGAWAVVSLIVLIAAGI